MAHLDGTDVFHGQGLCSYTNHQTAVRGCIFKMTSEERRQARYTRRQEKRQINRAIRLLNHDDFDDVFSYKNLYRAYHVCRLGVSWKASVQRFITQAPYEVYKIYRQLKDGKWKPGKFYEFDIYERGKVRHIKSVTMAERVIQRCLCDNAMVPAIGPSLIYDNGASTKNKGYHFAIARCKKHIQDHYRKYGTEGYVLLFDFSKFFDSISHALCKDIIDRAFDCDKTKQTIYKIVDSFGWGSSRIGLGLGSQVSQVFALATANRLDHFIKEVLKIKGYGRYMDDGYLIHPDKKVLMECRDQINRISQELGITLNLKKTQICKLSKGFTFLKCRFRLTETGRVVQKIYKRSVTKARQKLKKLKTFLDKGLLTGSDVYQSFQSWRSYASHFDAWHTIKNMDALYNMLFIDSPWFSMGFSYA